MRNLLNFAQAANDQLIITGGPQSTGAEPTTTTTTLTTQQAQTASTIGAGVGIAIFIFSIVALVFFIMALVHLIKNPNVPNRTLWIVLCVLFGGLAGFIYYVGPRRSFDKANHSSAPAGAPGQPAPYQGPVAQTQPVQAPQFTAPAAPSQPSPAPAPTPDFVTAEPTPVAPPTVAQPAPEVAVAPDNSMQLPQDSNVNSSSTFQPTIPQQDQPAAPQVFEPQPPQDVAPAPMPAAAPSEDNSNWPNPQNPTSQA